MVTQLLIDTVLWPLLIGVVVFIVGNLRFSWTTNLHPPVLLAAVAATLLILEGVPGWPLVSFKQKLPFILFIGAVFFWVWPLTFGRFRLLARMAAFAVVSLIPLLWLGMAVGIRKPLEFLTALAAISLTMAGNALFDKLSAGMPEPLKTAQIAAAAWSLVGLALVCTFGAFVGMAQINGAAAIAVGTVSIMAIGMTLLRSDFRWEVVPATIYAVHWVVAIYAAITALYTPKGSLVSTVLSALCLLVPSLLRIATAGANDVDTRATAHFLTAIAAGIPAFVAIAWAAGQFFAQS